MSTVTVTVPASPDGKWHYFVAYAHPKGSGMASVCLDRQVRSMDDVIAISKYIAGLPGMGDLVQPGNAIAIVNYQILSAPAPTT